jgi:DNA-binding PucR family transcriptional regulator
VAWDPSDGAVVALIRRVAAQVMDPATGALAEVEEAVLVGLGEPLRSDPVLAEEALASTRENAQHWIDHVTADPFTPVEPLMAPSVVGIARAASRRGADRNVWAAYNAGRNAVWRHWMRHTFAVSDDTEVVARSLDVVATSIGTWIDATLDQLAEHIRRERDELTRATHAQRFETVNLVLEGAPIQAASASERLGYQLRGRHLGAVLWTDPAAPDPAALSRAAEELRRRTSASQLLTVAANSFSSWVWVSGISEAATAAAPFTSAPDVRGAIGSPADGIDGFRRSHYEAVETQRLQMRRGAGGAGEVASFADVALVALAGRDEQAAREFVVRTLGRLSDADLELRETVRVYIRTMFNAARTAEVLFTHRNTVLNRIQRAERLLPEPLAVRGLEVGTALELRRFLRWGT